MTERQCGGGGGASGGGASDDAADSVPLSQAHPRTLRELAVPLTDLVARRAMAKAAADASAEAATDAGAKPAADAGAPAGPRPGGGPGGPGGAPLFPSQDCLLRPEGPGQYGCYIMSTALIVPESVMLFVGPQGCGRHGSVAGLTLGFHRRIFYLDVTEDEVISGSYVGRLEAMVARILELLPQTPRAFLICGTCIDDLQGTDLQAVARGLSAHHGIPFAVAIFAAMANRGPAGNARVQLQNSIFGLLDTGDPVQVDRRAVNLIGESVPLDPASELCGLLARAGFARVRQVPACASYDEFQAMRTASRNICLSPMARSACELMADRLGIPYHMMGGRSLLPQNVARTYDRLAECLDVSLDYQDAWELAEGCVTRASALVRGRRVAVGQGPAGDSFEVALLLARMGADVGLVVADRVGPDFDGLAKELLELAPEALVVPPLTPDMTVAGAMAAGELFDGYDLAVGFTAGRFCPGSSVVESDGRYVRFGFSAARRLVEDIRRAVEHPLTAREIFLSGGYVR